MPSQVSIRLYFFIFFVLISLGLGLVYTLYKNEDSIWLLVALGLVFSVGLSWLASRPFQQLVTAVRQVSPEGEIVAVPKFGLFTPVEAKELAEALALLARRQAEAKAALAERVAERTAELAFSRDQLFKQNIELDNLNLALTERNQENQELLIETLYRSRELSVLNEMSRDALAARGLDDLNRRALNRATALLAVPVGLIGLLSDRGEHWYSSEGLEINLESDSSSNPSTHVQNLLLHVFQTEAPLVIEELKDDNQAFQAIFEATDLQSAIFFPLYSPEDKKPLGVLVLGDHKPREWRADEIELMTTISNQLALSNSYARLVDEIANERNRFDAVLNGVSEGVVLVDNRDRLLFANPAALRSMGLNSVGSFSDNPTAEFLLVPAALSRQLAASEAVEPVQVERDGRTWGVSINQIFENTGEFIGVAQVQRDITEAARVDRMKTEFISLVSHELRTPLTSIKGYLELILDGDTGPLNDIQRRFLETARNGSDRLMNLINDLLDVSRIESGKIELECSLLYITGAISNVVEPLRLAAQERDLDLVVKVAPNLPPAWADRDRVTQILTNLLSNALKYNQPGGSVEISAALSEDQHFVKIEVRDTGMGMTEEEQEQLFKKFFRSSNPLVRSISGTGLGLAITKALVEMHGGEIWVQSVPKQGSTFGFSLPLALQPQPEALPEKAIS